MRYWTIKEEKLALELANKGVPYKEIADKTNRTKKSIEYKLQELNATCLNYNWWTDEEWKEAQRLKNGGIKMSEIAIVLSGMFGTARDRYNVSAKFSRERRRMKNE